MPLGTRLSGFGGKDWVLRWPWSPSRPGVTGARILWGKGRVLAAAIPVRQVRLKTYKAHCRRWLARGQGLGLRRQGGNSLTMVRCKCCRRRSLRHRPGSSGCGPKYVKRGARLLSPIGSSPVLVGRPHMVPNGARQWFCFAVEPVVGVGGPHAFVHRWCRPSSVPATAITIWRRDVRGLLGIKSVRAPGGRLITVPAAHYGARTLTWLPSQLCGAITLWRTAATRSCVRGSSRWVATVPGLVWPLDAPRRRARCELESGMPSTQTDRACVAVTRTRFGSRSVTRTGLTWGPT